MTAQMQAPTLTYRCPHCGTPVEVEACAEGSLLRCPAPMCGKPFRVAVPVAEPIEQPTNLALPPGVEPPRPAPAAQPITCAPGGTTAPAAVSPVVSPAATTPVTAPPVAATSVAAAPVVAAPHEEPEGQPHVISLSMFRRYPFRCLGYLLLAAASVAAVIYGLQQDWHWLTIIGAIVFVLGAGRFFLWWLRMSRTTLILTNKRVILTTGVFTRESIEFELARVNDYHIHQSLPMRWLNVGDLAIVSTDRRVVVMAVPDPHAVAAFLQGHIAARKKEEEQPDMVVVQQPVATQGAPTHSA